MDDTGNVYKIGWCIIKNSIKIKPIKLSLENYTIIFTVKKSDIMSSLIEIIEQIKNTVVN